MTKTRLEKIVYSFHHPRSLTTGRRARSRESLGDYIARFTREMEEGTRLNIHKLRYGPSTIKNYKGFVVQFDEYCKARRKQFDFADIDLKFYDDFVNMGLAKLVDAPVLLIGDIDRGGVFAQLYGTIALLESDERARVKGTIINKFRGDRAILEPGLRQLEALCGVPVAGVVPYTRGRERSRDPQTIVDEARTLFENGYREVTLLGQNVNSYRAGEVDFPELLRRVAAISPLLRVRFATSHPKDMSDRLLEVMAATPNICRAIHLPAQSGATSMLERMNRRYTREWYLSRVAAIRRLMPDCAITTDLIAGFSGETEEEHLQTLSLMREVGYDFAYMFKYSERPGTFAQKHLPDDVPDGVKSRRLQEIIALQNELGHASNLRDVGREFEVLVEGESRRDAKQLSGRTSQNKVVVFDRGTHRVGDYVRVRITGCTPATLFGEEIGAAQTGMNE